MDIIISIIGALSAIIVAAIGAFLANKNSNTLQIRKLKEEHYISYIEALHNLASDNNNPKTIKEYTYHRDKLLIIGSEKVIQCIIQYEELAVGKDRNLHDKYLTNIVKAIREDLKIKDKNFPPVYLKK